MCKQQALLCLVLEMVACFCVFTRTAHRELSTLHLPT